MILYSSTCTTEWERRRTVFQSTLQRVAVHSNSDEVILHFGAFSQYPPAVRRKIIRTVVNIRLLHRSQDRQSVQDLVPQRLPMRRDAVHVPPPILRRDRTVLERRFCLGLEPAEQESACMIKVQQQFYCNTLDWMQESSGIFVTRRTDTLPSHSLMYECESKSRT